MNWFTGLKIALLGVITAALVACGAVPSDGASPTDAAVTDRPAPPPDVIVTPDTPLPPPPDAMQIAPDLPPPPPDAPAEDASVPPMDTPPPPPDVVMTDTMNRIGLRFNECQWRAENSKNASTISYEDGQIVIGTQLRIQIRARYSEGACNPTTMSCQLPLGGATDGCTFTELTPGMNGFYAECQGARTHVVAVPGSCM